MATPIVPERSDTQVIALVTPSLKKRVKDTAQRLGCSQNAIHRAALTAYLDALDAQEERSSD